MLEQIVRPFQLRETISDRTTPVTTVVKAAPQKAALVWGAAGQDPELTNTGVNVFTTKDKGFKEISRKTTDVRIENPDDPNQFIIAQRINSIEFSSPKSATSTSDSVTTYKSSSGDTSSSSAAAAPTNTYTLKNQDAPSVSNP